MGRYRQICSVTLDDVFCEISDDELLEELKRRRVLGIPEKVNIVYRLHDLEGAILRQDWLVAERLVAHLIGLTDQEEVKRLQREWQKVTDGTHPLMHMPKAAEAP